jgi:hypothetical protein
MRKQKKGRFWEHINHSSAHLPSNPFHIPKKAKTLHNNILVHTIPTIQKSKLVKMFIPQASNNVNKPTTATSSILKMIIPRTLNTPTSASPILESTLQNVDLTPSNPSAAASSAAATEAPAPKISATVIVIPVLILILVFAIIGGIFLYMRRNPKKWQNKTPAAKPAKNVKDDESDGESVRNGRGVSGDDWVGKGART